VKNTFSKNVAFGKTKKVLEIGS